MLETILESYQKADFDFRRYANPSDPLSYLFDEWVPYYRMKHSLAKTIHPRSILEVGVRYGYSAIAFLEGSPEAQYLGIDNDSGTFGGCGGAIDWARKITSPYHAQFLIADSQEMTSFPNDFYDLIHIDGQQDGDSTIHDLELALEKGRWILLDGYFWSVENMLSASYFLGKYRQFIEYSCIIPSYAGELLVKTSESARHIFTNRKERRYSLLKELYSRDYYLRDCGGYDQFKKNRGGMLEDPRLMAVYDIADPREGKKILDIGCGRGELSNALAEDGADVTGIDFSPAAIGIARQTFPGSGPFRNLRFLNEDFLDAKLDSGYDVIIATDFIEHIEPEKIGVMLSRIAGLLGPEGLFVVHTSPNLLYYQYGYAEERKTAARVGTYLPKNPRSYYEDLMHINEQTPDSLSALLRDYFSTVIVWSCTLPDPVGSLGRDLSTDEMIRTRDIFAVSAHGRIEKDELLRRIRQAPLDRSDLAVSISSGITRIQCRPCESLAVPVLVKNRGPERFVSRPPNPVHLSYHWLSLDGDYEVFEGLRTPLRIPLRPSESREVTVTVTSPERRGWYTLQITLVQESVVWFEQAVRNLPLTIEALVL